MPEKGIQTILKIIKQKSSLRTKQTNWIMIQDDGCFLGRGIPNLELVPVSPFINSYSLIQTNKT